MAEISALEQYMLELVNAERAKVGAQPLAFNLDLAESAENHTGWMIEDDVFSHTGSEGSSAGERMAAAGYDFTGSWGWGENIAWRSLGGAAGYQDEVAAMHAALMNSPGHKANILNGSYREIGIGVEVGNLSGTESAVVTQNFAYSGTGLFLTGVAFDDQDGDRLYDVGEGLGGVSVSVVGSEDATFWTSAMEGGGYQILVPAGSYTVTFSCEGLAERSEQVAIESRNVKLDWIDPALEPVEGDELANVLDGTSGDDTIRGLDGDDVLHGLGGADLLDGGAGDDAIQGGAGKDTLDGGSGIDTAAYSDKTVAVAVTLNGSANAKVTVGGAAEDTIRNIENLEGGSAADKLTGDAQANVLEGNGGNDTLQGGAGNDALEGGLGKDTLDGGSGYDTADFTDKTSAVVATLKGSSKATVTVGGSAEDTIRNIENLEGGSAADKLIGDSLANVLEGNGGGDFLKGGAGNDVLSGGAGSDTLDGGSGRDVFVFDAALDAAANVDKIVNFSVADDTISLDDDIFGGLEGTLTEAEFALGSAAAQADHRILYDPSTGALRYDADGVGGAEATQFATLTAGLNLSEADFLVM